MQEFSMQAEPTTIIPASKVDGTSVFNPAGENVGEIHDIIIDKLSGKVAYAVMSFGGFLGLGTKYHPLPWASLKYDTNLNGYVVDVDRHQLEGAPSFDTATSPDWTDREYEKRLHDYYGLAPYWVM
jgi:hypothetical protein